MNMYHLGHTSAGTPIALTQGMDNILQPPTRKLVSSPFHMNLIGGGGSLIKTAVSDPLLHWTVLSLTLAPHQAFFVPHHHCSLNFTVIYQVGLKGHHAVPSQLHAIVLSSFASKVSCVAVLHNPGAIKKKREREMMPFPPAFTVCRPTWAQDTGHKPVLCSSPERLIINRLKYSRCRLVFWPLAPMSKALGETCHVVRQKTPFISQDSSGQKDLDR